MSKLGAQCANYYSKLLIVLITSCCGSLTGENEMLKLVLEKINPMAKNARPKVAM